MPVRSESASDINEEEHEHIPAEMIENIQHKLLIRSIERRLFTIEQCYFNPQILTIEGYGRLRNLPGQQHWKSKIYTQKELKLLQLDKKEEREKKVSFLYDSPVVERSKVEGALSLSFFKPSRRDL